MIRSLRDGRQWLARQDDWGLVLALSALLLVLRAGYVGWVSPYGLAPDEAQYWTWLTHNDWSFLTKPPLTTWLMGVSTSIFGQTMLGVKAFALLGQVVTAVLGFALARVAAPEANRRAAGWWAWALLTSAPLISAGGLIMSPDAVLLPLWLGAILLVAMKAKGEALGARWWLAIGVLVGLAGLAKYSAALFAPLLLVFVLGWKRAWLKDPALWGAGLVALLMQVPVLIWNAQHDWVGIAHVLWQTDGGGDNRHGGVKSLLEFLGSQALVLGPVVFGLVLAAWAQMGRKTQAVRVVWMFSLPIFAFFVLMTLHGKVQANWPVLGAVGGLIYVAVWVAQRRQTWVVWLAVGGVALNVFLSAVMLDTAAFRAWGLFPVAAKNDPTKDLRGWPEMGNLLGVLLYRVEKPIVLSSRYQTLAPLVFHTRGNPEWAYMNAEERRLNEYDLWAQPELRDRVVIYVNEQGVVPPKVVERFTQCVPWHTLAVEERGVVARKMSLFVCWGAK